MTQSNTNSSVLMHTAEKDANLKGSTDTAWGIWERIIPDQIAHDPASQRILQIHLHRYETAAHYAKGKKVLDIACGVGYGSQMLHLAGAASVVGVDLSPVAITHASENYQAPNLQFVCANAEAFEWPEPLDLIVSFETLEHLPHPDQFLQRMGQLLTPEGCLLLSAPLGETRHLDAYHLHAFSQEDIFSLLEQAGFRIKQSRCDDWVLSRSDLLHWQRLYPESQASLSELFFTSRGQRLLWDFLIRGGFRMPQLMVVAQKESSVIPSVEKAIQSP